LLFGANLKIDLARNPTVVCKHAYLVLRESDRCPVQQERRQGVLVDTERDRFFDNFVEKHVGLEGL
jgi:hypothetical protein